MHLDSLLHNNHVNVVIDAKRSWLWKRLPWLFSQYVAAPRAGLLCTWADWRSSARSFEIRGSHFGDTWRSSQGKETSGRRNACSSTAAAAAAAKPVASAEVIMPASNYYICGSRAGLSISSPGRGP